MILGLARLLLVPVLYGWLLWVGNQLSTVSAQLLQSAVIPGIGIPSSYRRRPQEPAEGGVATYSRYSSDMQDEVSIPQQQRPCRELAQKHDWTVDAEFEFTDEAESGQLLNRTGFDACMAAARAGKIRVLIVWNLSRLARSMLITMKTLKELVEVLRVRVISVTEGLDTINPGWESQAFIRAFVHEEYIRVLRDTVLRGAGRRDSQRPQCRRHLFWLSQRADPRQRARSAGTQSKAPHAEYYQ